MEKLLTKKLITREFKKLNRNITRQWKLWEVSITRSCKLDAKVKARTGQSWNHWEEAKKVLEEYGYPMKKSGRKLR